MQLVCAFCGRDEKQVETMFRGLQREGHPAVFICCECVAMCAKRLPPDFEPSTITLPKRERSEKPSEDPR